VASAAELCDLQKRVLSGRCWGIGQPDSQQTNVSESTVVAPKRCFPSHWLTVIQTMNKSQAHACIPPALARNLQCPRMLPYQPGSSLGPMKASLVASGHPRSSFSTFSEPGHICSSLRREQTHTATTATPGTAVRHDCAGKRKQHNARQGMLALALAKARTPAQVIVGTVADGKVTRHQDKFASDASWCPAQQT
jgi:hypothetical protein